MPNISNGFMDFEMCEQVIYPYDQSIVRAYNYRPDEFSFNKLSDEDEPYMGVEIEVDGGGRNSDIAKQAMDIANEDSEVTYCKHDGSLECGFEVVTQPCTLEFHKTIKYKEMFEFLSKSGYKAHDTRTCGLHVHIDRKYFGEDKLSQDLCASKLLYIFEKFWDRIELVARRRSNDYARRVFIYGDETPLDLYAKAMDGDKYMAINLRYRETIEIRIFKGTLNYNTFINTLEFVSKISKFVKKVSINDIQNVTWEEISESFSEDLNEYILRREESVAKRKKEEESRAAERSGRRVNRANFIYEPMFYQYSTWYQTTKEKENNYEKIKLWIICKRN